MELSVVSSSVAPQVRLALPHASAHWHCLSLLPPQGGRGVPTGSLFIFFSSSGVVTLFSYFPEYSICPTASLMPFLFLPLCFPSIFHLAIPRGVRILRLLTVLFTCGSLVYRGSRVVIIPTWNHCALHVASGALTFALIHTISNDGFTKTKTDLFLQVLSQQVTSILVSLEKINFCPVTTQRRIYFAT